MNSSMSSISVGCFGISAGFSRTKRKPSSTRSLTLRPRSAASAYSRDAKRPAAAQPRNGKAGFTPAKQSHRKLETQYVPFGPAGVVLPEEGFEELDAAREWLFAALGSVLGRIHS